MDRKSWMARSITVAMATMVVACAKKEEEPQANIEVASEPAPPPPVTMDLVPAGGSAVMGTVTATHAQDNTTLQISLSGLIDDRDYDAKVRYGDCTIAPQHLTSDAPAAPTTTTGGAMPNAEHELGDDFMSIRLNKEGTTATGEATVDNDDLRMDESAYVVVTQDDKLVACADLKGHGGMGSTAPGATGANPSMGPNTTPMPSDSMHR